ncbi:unnamed protein product [Rotaria sordida]|uniref:Uncharacterized protein n=1 Tax=Rotaria sordida TaxID=392033 RepID=A0A814JD98_9BILA|nr:unnamed protein product [Rotaria sordida]
MECPLGKPMISKCPGDKKATCIADCCGGCNALWFGVDGREAKCNEKPACPNGQEKVQCLKDPCQGATCPAYPKATCVSNNCGSCKAQWYKADGTPVNCIKSSPCPPGQTQVKCLKDPCQGATCPACPSAKCVPNYCDGCHALWYKADGTPTNCAKPSPCPPGQNEVQCKKDPCEGATCPAYPTAKCVSNYCGGCNALWYKADGTPVNCIKSSPCPPGQTQVKCLKDPCQGATCPAYATAKCVSNYCGGCNALWYKADGTPVNCTKSSPCPPGQNQVKCLKDPCQGATCPACPTAKCVSNYCGGCHALWYKADGTPANCAKSSPCPPGQNEVQCKKDPCEGATCPAYPTAKCVSNYCGGCNALWYKADGTSVSCAKSSPCPPGQDEVHCTIDPCEGATCPAYPEAICISNYCGGCNALWYKADGTPVNCTKSSTCPPGQEEVECTIDPCEGATCPAYPTAKCVSNYCGGCNALWYKADGTTVDCNKSSPCPPGEDEVHCTIDPCESATCPAYPDATCVSNYCGGCNALWYKADGTSVNCTKSSPCPPGQDEVHCTIDPCESATCPAYPDATCVSNYCGGCNALWYKADGTSDDHKRNTLFLKHDILIFRRSLKVNQEAQQQQAATIVTAKLQQQQFNGVHIK